MNENVKVKLRIIGEVGAFSSSGVLFGVGDKVIVEVDRGLEYGVVVPEKADISYKASGAKSSSRVIRKVNPWDEEQINKNKGKGKELIDIAKEKIKKHNLDMKIVDAEYSFDRSKIIFYFTSEARVDFRELVKDLAGAFRVRIELKQIGARDETKIMGGCGPCGRKLCCSSFLTKFSPITMKMAKTQDLPLIPAKLAGACGKLKCCLEYENDTYAEFSKGLPRTGDEISGKSCGCSGKCRVVGVNILKRSVTVEAGGGNVKKVDYNETHVVETVNA